MKKKTFIVGVPLAVIVIFAAVYIFVLFSAQSQIDGQARSYEPYSVSSFDGKYLLTTHEIGDDKTGSYAAFTISSGNTQTVLFTCPDRYRTLDLKSVGWDGNTYDAKVVSGDVGTVIYSADKWLTQPETSPVATDEKTPAIPDIDLADYANELEDVGFYNVFGCADGSFLVGINFDNGMEYTYFSYTPPLSERGTPVLFTRLYWSDDYEVSVGSDGTAHLSIPMRANENEDYRFRLEADVGESTEHLELRNCELILLDPADIEANAATQDILKDVPIPIGETAKYHGFFSDNEWIPEAGAANAAVIAALRIAVYGGDASALLRLYALASAGADTGSSINTLQLAALKLTDNQTIHDKTSKNSLLQPVIYGEGAKSFPAQAALKEAAESVRLYNPFSFRDGHELESNIDTERKTTIANYSDFFDDHSDYPDRIWGAYELDFDGDGLTELVYFYAGGTMGNEFWEIIHLDKDGLITAVDNGEDMRMLSMVQINGRYYFVNWEYDYNDKQDIGLNLFAMKKDGKLWQARVYREVTGVRTVFSDVYTEDIKPLYDDISGRLFDFYKQYKAYYESEFEKPAKPDEQTAGLFKSEGYGNYELGYVDIDNDRADDIIGEWMYWPSSAHQIFTYDIRTKMSCAEHTFNLNTMLSGQDDLLRVFTVQYEGKNYFLTMQPFGDSQYIFKLQEISGDKPYVLAAWIVTAEDRVTVTAEEYMDEGW